MVLAKKDAVFIKMPPVTWSVKTTIRFANMLIGYSKNMVILYEEVVKYQKFKLSPLSRTMIDIIILQTQLSPVVLKTLQNVGASALGATLADMVTMRSAIPMNATTG